MREGTATMTHDKNTLMSLQGNYVLGTYAPDLMLVKGDGARVWDIDGKEYLDFAAGISVCNLGHCHPKVTAAIREQAGKLVHVSNLYYNENQPQLAARIAETSFGGRVFFANSGAEANEGLIKFARRWGSDSGRYEIICMNDSFHGRTLATLAATGRAKYRKGFAPDMEGFVFADFNDLESVRAKIGPKTVAVLCEPIQGEGGILPATAEFLEGLRQLCDEQDLLLLFDEVQCGMGRTGHMFAYQSYGVVPDGMSMAKALGNGFPIGAFEVQEKYEGTLPPGTHASTFGGTPLACAAGIAVFEAFAEEHVLDNVQRVGEHLLQALNGLCAKFPAVKSVRGAGLMLGVVVEGDLKPVLAKAKEAGLLVLTAGENVLRLLPPLTITIEQADQAVAILEEALAEGLAEA
jgi:predicted acetylornithine/succinylornithine family transaminase